MVINGFRVEQKTDSHTGIKEIIVKDVSDLSPYGFDIKGTFESGQCFRWNRNSDGSYSGIVGKRAVRVYLEKNRDLRIVNATQEDFGEIWYDYFDLKTDYTSIVKAVDKDEFMHSSVKFSAGARLLSQQFEETLFSYIISAQNNIPRIKKLVESLCMQYGEKIYIPDESGRIKTAAYSFPDAKRLSFDFCKNKSRHNCRGSDLCENPFAGYRCPYIKKTAEMLEQKQFVFDPVFLHNTDQETARKELCRLPGVGEKVSDCVLLYTGTRTDICPVDTWVEKTIRHFYLGEKAGKKDIRKFTGSYFGDYAGYAQLWFFNYSRTHRMV